MQTEDRVAAEPDLQKLTLTVGYRSLPPETRRQQCAGHRLVPAIIEQSALGKIGQRVQERELLHLLVPQGELFGQEQFFNTDYIP